MCRQTNSRYAAFSTTLPSSHKELYQHLSHESPSAHKPNTESEAFHAARGYERKAHFEKCGYKMGQWWDIVWMQKVIAPHDEAPEPFRRFTGGF